MAREGPRAKTWVEWKMGRASRWSWWDVGRRARLDREEGVEFGLVVGPGETGYLAGLACCRVDLDLALCAVGVEEGEDVGED